MKMIGKKTPSLPLPLTLIGIGQFMDTRSFLGENVRDVCPSLAPILQTVTVFTTTTGGKFILFYFFRSHLTLVKVECRPIPGDVAKKWVQEKKKEQQSVHFNAFMWKSYHLSVPATYLVLW